MTSRLETFLSRVLQYDCHSLNMFHRVLLRAQPCAQRALLSKNFASASAAQAKTGILMVNMGGPKDLDEVGSFLRRLFQDREIIQLPFLQEQLGNWISTRRTPAIQEQYAAIGGGSPILKWTDLQGEGMCNLLNDGKSEQGPFKHYVAFRYAAPLTEDALKQIENDGIEHLIVFSQYPQWSCTTAGASCNELTRQLRAKYDGSAPFRISVVDRWFEHPSFIKAVAGRITAGLEKFSSLDGVHVLFSAHSLPVDVVDRGDTYAGEVASTMYAVMRQLQSTGGAGSELPFSLAWQSKVGPKRWVAPSTEHTLKQLGSRGYKKVLVVPIAFTSDHIETLFELDLEYGEVAEEAGISEYIRAPALNDDPLFIQAQADIIRDHLASGRSASTLYNFRCPDCTNPDCRQLLKLSK